MTRIIFPLFLVLLAGSIFFFFTSPLITNPAHKNPETGDLGGGVIELRSQQEILSKAIRDSENLKGRIDTLNRQLDSVPQISRLDNFLPTQLDEIQLIVDVNNIARQSGMAIGEIDIRADSANQNQRGGTPSAGSGDPQVRNLTMSFAVVGSYGQLKSFLGDLARSLRIMDVESLSFSLSEDGRNRYNIRITTYWLN